MTDRLCLLSIHAHPDDEASKGAGAVAKYHAEGVHTVLVTCTGGEEGEITFAELDTRARALAGPHGGHARASPLVGGL